MNAVSAARLLLLLVLMAGLVACAAPTTPASNTTTRLGLATAASTLTPDPRLPTAVPTGDPRGIGNPNAPIQLVEFTDYECPFCAVFATETKPQIIAEYVETGQVYLVVRDFPLPNHRAAPQAAASAHCAAQQRRFQPMHDRIFIGFRNREWGDGGAGDREVFAAYAREIGLDTAAFAACLADPATQQAVENDIAAGLQLGINSTPTFLINGSRVAGAQSYAFWQDVFDEILQQR